MLTLKEYTQEMLKESNAKVRFSESVIGKGAKQVSSAASSALKSLYGAMKKAQSPEKQRKTLESFLKSPAGRLVRESASATKAVGRFAKRIFSSKGPGGKRQLDVGKGLIITAPALGMYLGMKKGQMKAKQSPYYGQRKPPVLYSDPRRRLR